MKKSLALIALLFTLASYAKPIPAWDKPLQKAKAFTDPYVTNYGAYQIGTKFSPDYGVEIQVSFNQSVPVPYYAVVQVMGTWDNNGGSPYRDFTVYLNQGQWHKTEVFPMSTNEEVYVATAGLTDYGPQ